VPALCSSRVRDPRTHERQSQTGLERNLSPWPDLPHNPTRTGLRPERSTQSFGMLRTCSRRGYEESVVGQHPTTGGKNR